MLARLTLILSLACLAPSAAAKQLTVSKSTPFGNVSLSWGNRGYSKHSSYNRRYNRPAAGHYKTIKEKVWVPASKHKVWVEPVYKTWFDSCGTPRRSLVQAGHYKVVVEPGHYTWRHRRVWVPAQPACRTIVRH